MVEASSFIQQIQRSGYTLCIGVPCSFLKPLINYAIDDPSVEYVAANNEGEAVAYAIGAWLAGRDAVVMFQNSGLGNAINPLTSLALPFQIPLLFIITWRGQPGLSDEPQHDVMGQRMADLLALLGIASAVLDGDEGGVMDQLVEARRHLDLHSVPYALILRKGTVAPYELRAPPTQPHRAHCPVLLPREDGPTEMKRYDCVRLVADLVGEEHVIIATTGKTGRELYTHRDSRNHLYVVGGMGCASTIGLGLARHTDTATRVVVIDGDGAALMRLEALVSIGHFQPRNLVHLILDNNAHDSTGGQQTLSHTVDFPAVGNSVGYRYSRTITTWETLRQELQDALARDGPSLLHVPIRPGSLRPLGRPTVHPSFVARRLKRWLEAS